MHGMIVMRSNVTRTNFGVIMHLSVGASHLLLHNDVRISVKALDHILLVLLTVLEGFAISTIIQILLLLIGSSIPLIVYLLTQLILSKL